MNQKHIGAEGQLLICTPLIGMNEASVTAELAAILPKKPDVIEWRADFFEDVADTDAVIGMARTIKALAGNVPIIFTLRCEREGGRHISLSDAEIIELRAAVCRKSDVEYVDCELSHTGADIAYLSQVAKESDTKIIGSYHNFACTPGNDFLMEKLVETENRGLDIAKIAVMPQSLDDVLRLLSVTLAAKARLKVPLISISMGEYGVITRIVNGLFGSSLTFATGQGSSAPGQMPIDDLHNMLALMQQSTGIHFGNRWI